ncbi:hypothetical protein ACFOTA_17395 [Chitinophaga sp. GCM10012297]|uniref:Uncharacterized protein n=1 Tax=Chitinophaga chungangae TaxID=2821488 RepID=A0ABS3YH46_9BACT|nr:hypothetical protein [Chitinophaga chungangae]MBO9153997.1 hypothetical protein [Chitinophaga chungangae]
MITFLLIIGVFCGLLLVISGVLAALILVLMHRSPLPAELAYCPVHYDDGNYWEGCA